MRLDTEFVRLPLHFDAGRLAAEVTAFAETDWVPHPQGFAGNSALLLVSRNGDPKDDATSGRMQRTPLLDQSPYLGQVLASFQSVIGRTRLMRIDGNAEATLHCDSNYYWNQRVRIHVPIITDPAVRFFCGERSLHMSPGQAWIFNTWKLHNVVNPRPTRRIHLVADTVGSPAFWRMVREGERPFDPSARPATADTHIQWDPELAPDFPTEKFNRPVVMSPWELESLYRFWEEEIAILPNAGVAAVHAMRSALRRYLAEWQSLWAVHADTQPGWQAYEILRVQLDSEMRAFEHAVSLANGVDSVELIRQYLIRPALDMPQAGGAGTPAAAPRGRRGRRPLPRFDRPVFIVSSPRAGSTMLFETLTQSPDLMSIGGESHQLIEGIGELSPRARGYESNRLIASDVSISVMERLKSAFVQQVRDREGNRLARPFPESFRLLEKTPKNSLRVPFFATAFPDALFVYLYRDPRETISSMLDAWRSEKFVTYRRLPGWPGTWSLLLTPGWRDLAGKSLPQIVAEQWRTATEYLLNDLEELDPSRWCVTSYDRILADPQKEIERLCQFIGVRWDRDVSEGLPLSKTTLTSPSRDKWMHNAEELKEVLPLVESVARRAHDVFANPPATRTPPPPAFRPLAGAAASQPSVPPAGPQAFRSVHTQSFADIIRASRSSFLVSTYQSGRVVTLRLDESGKLATHFREFASPMGIAVGRKALAIGTRWHVHEYQNLPSVAAKLEPKQRHDACFLPRRAHVTGDIRIHEMSYAADDELWIVNTRFSCLSTLDAHHSFVPRWQPPFITAFEPTDRCHLNGLAMIDGKPKYVTALGETDQPAGWRPGKATGGMLMDVDSREIVVRGLSMPHSPRWYAGQLWILESGEGRLSKVDVAKGIAEPFVELPGFTRGLAFLGQFAFVGLSQVRESVFGGIPIAHRLRDRLCGVWVVDLEKARVAGFLRFEGAVQEIFDIQVLHGLRFPEVAELDSPLLASSFVLPDRYVSPSSVRRP